MKNKDMTKCTRTRKHKFIFWEWETTEEHHSWRYWRYWVEGETKKEYRQCFDCGKTEILWGIKRNEAGEYEDWRAYRWQEKLIDESIYEK